MLGLVQVALLGRPTGLCWAWSRAVARLLLLGHLGLDQFGLGQFCCWAWKIGEVKGPNGPRPKSL